MASNRNKPCTCGSGRKYKVCCLRKEEMDRLQRLAQAKAAWLARRQRMADRRAEGLTVNTAWTATLAAARMYYPPL